MKKSLMSRTGSTREIIDMYQEEIAKLTEERNKFLTIAHNAICLWQEENMYGYDEDEWKEHVISELDIYADEYDKIMN